VSERASDGERGADTLRRDLVACTGDGATYFLMAGACEGNFAAFVLALGKGSVLGGLSATVPNMLGSVVQLASPAGLRRLGSPRRWVQGCAAVQGASLLAMAAGAWAGRMPTWLLYGCIAVYWASALGAGPAWNTWVARLFPARLRTRYFAARNRLCNILMLVSMLAAGWLLREGEAHGWQMGAFAAVLAGAAVARLSSIPFLQRQGDIRLAPEDVRAAEWRSLPRRLLHGDLRAMLFLVCLQGALQSGGPFITPWLREELRFDMWRFTICIAMVFVARSVAMPLSGRVIRRLGASRSMSLGAFGAALAMLLLPVSSSLGWILFVQAFAGASLACVDLAGFLLLLETIDHRERTSLMSIYLLLTCTAQVAGSLLGALLLATFASPATGYAAIFLVSGVLRLLVLLVRPPRPRARAVTVSVDSPA
jgi:MFS family permease